MASLGSFNIMRDTECVVVICPEHLQTLKNGGWSKRDVQEFLFMHARRPLADLVGVGLANQKSVKSDDAMTGAVSDPSHILLIAGGGEAGRFSAVLHGWGSRSQSCSVTKKINLDGSADDG
jgi:hypothetical protein